MEPSEDVRRIQRTGQSTFIVSLPKKWVEEFNLKKGDLIVIAKQRDRSLLLTPKGSRRQSNGEVTLRFSPSEEASSTIRKVVALYFAGFNIIHLLSSDGNIRPDQRDMIKEFIRRKFVGTEVMSESRNEMTIQVLLSYPDFPIDTAIRRMSLLTSSMHQDVLEALKELNHDLADQVLKMDDEIDRFDFYIQRQLNSMREGTSASSGIRIETSRESLGYRMIVKAVERIADHAVKIAENVKLINKPLGSELYHKMEKMSEFSISLFRSSMDSLMKADIALADEVVRKKDAIEGYERELLRFILSQGHPLDVVGSLRLMVQSLKRTAEYSSDIAEAVLDIILPTSDLVSVVPVLSQHQ